MEVIEAVDGPLNSGSLVDGRLRVGIRANVKSALADASDAYLHHLAAIKLSHLVADGRRAGSRGATGSKKASCEVA